jgi:hypothetical protein
MPFAFVRIMRLAIFVISSGLALSGQILPPLLQGGFVYGSTVPLNGTVRLLLNVSNPNAGVRLEAVSFIDSLPDGLTIAETPNAQFSCEPGNYGAFQAEPLARMISFSASLSPGSQGCTVQVTLTAAKIGSLTNSVTVQDGNTLMSALTVIGPPTLAKVFGATAIVQGGGTTLTFTLTNPNPAINLTGITFTDVLSPGIVFSGAVQNGCGNGAIRHLKPGAGHAPLGNDPSLGPPLGRFRAAGAWGDDDSFRPRRTQRVRVRQAHDLLQLHRTRRLGLRSMALPHTALTKRPVLYPMQ